MRRAISIDQLYKTKRKVLPFDTKWREFMGNPECKGSIIIWGKSSNGKTSFAVQFANYISTFKKVLYNSIEEGDSGTLVESFKRAGVTVDNKNLQVLDKESLKDLRERLSKHKSPDVIFIDSVQHWRVNAVECKTLATDFPDKLFIFISHADGSEPKGETAVSVKYDANIKIYVCHFVAMAESRCQGCKRKPFIISEERVREKYGFNYDGLFDNE